MKDIFEPLSARNHKFINANTLIATLFSLLIGIIISAFVIKNETSITSSIICIAGASILLGFFTRELAWRFNTIIKNRTSWPEHSLKAMIISFIPVFLSSFLSSLILLKALCFFTKNTEIESFGILIWSFAFSSIFNLGLYAVLFLEKWKETIIREENLKKEQLSLQYDNLVSRANPSMLFSSLASLKEKVSKNPDDAVKFVKQISDFYRYSLDQRNKDIVEISEELNYVKNLAQLLQAQFPAFEFFQQIKIEQNMYILPFCAGALIEHIVLNSNSRKELKIRLEHDIENLILIISGLSEDSLPLELTETIQEKYSILTEKKLKVEMQDSFYKIYIPLIDVK